MVNLLATGVLVTSIIFPHGVPGPRIGISPVKYTWFAGFLFLKHVRFPRSPILNIGGPTFGGAIGKIVSHGLHVAFGFSADINSIRHATPFPDSPSIFPFSKAVGPMMRAGLAFAQMR